jgi:hypothetical protein
MRRSIRIFFDKVGQRHFSEIERIEMVRQSDPRRGLLLHNGCSVGLMCFQLPGEVGALFKSRIPVLVHGNKLGDG